MLNNSKKSLIAIGVMALMGATTVSNIHAEVTAKAVVDTYANIAFAGYEDALISAKSLDKAIAAFLANPSKETQDAAKSAWLAARVPYQQTEAYRFGNPIVDDWEGRVNAWPLDEGLIDYVDTEYYGEESDENPLFRANIIANSKLLINGKEVDATNITPEFLAGTLHEAGESEANVATGYHAIEFLLWGQDLNLTGKGSGVRSYTDFDLKNCTNGNCDRRRQYLSAVTALLVTDLEEMVANWKSDGAARNNLEKNPDVSISAILTGMGSLSYGELAGERIKLGLLLHDPEEEHDCFSDNTHNSHFYDAKGIQNVYLGSYTRIDGSVVSGASVSDLVAAKDRTIDTELTAKLTATMTAMTTMKKRAESVEAYDQMIGEGNKQGNMVVQATVDGLVNQTRSIERAVNLLGLKRLEIEGSDSLDKPKAVFE